MRRSPRTDAEPPPAEAARGAALALLARRDHGEGELRRKLLRKGFDAPAVEAALDAVGALGLLDDGALLPRLVRHYREARGYGRAKVAAALRGRGFDPGAVAEALRHAFPEGEEAAEAAEALRRKFRGAPPAGREGAARAYRFLAGRGFSPAACRAALGRVLSDTDSDTEEGEP